ncbi:MAG: formate dehydrogenase major subunit [Acidimicrobiaceae bacterium]|nr:formate dehydrogenase major subunit [Acidimicrobiaceae bacterium]
MPGLGTSFGRGGATTFQQDLANADCIVIMGSNMAECHPVGFQWVMEAKDRGAKVIHIDPRFTRTSAVSDLHVPLRAGSDIVFLGAIVNHILSNERDFREYVVSYTNAAAIVDEGFQDTEDLDGLFSGWDAESAAYDPATWQYAGNSDSSGKGDGPGGVDGPGGQGHGSTEVGADTHGGHGPPTGGHPEMTDPTLQHPRCVYQLLKRHFARYTPELVEELCGVPPHLFAQVADALCENSGRERTSAFCYAVGWTQHTVGVQYIRTASIIQLLLGNIGRPGGGIMALRGHASIQGSTDIPTLYNILPGYLPMPDAETADLDDYVERNAAKTGFWGNMRAYLVSLLKAYWGAAARSDNDFCFDWLPRLTGDHSTYQTMLDMLDGKVRGMFVMGENPAVGSANSKLHRMAMAKLDWLVVRDFSEIESASFWYDGPEIETGEMTTEQIPTEVFLLPAASHTEKDGSFTNTQRMLQWHHKAVEPEGDARSELWFSFHLGRIIREKLRSSADIDNAKDRPVLDLAWDYPTEGALDEPSAAAVLREINGWGADGKALGGFADLADDGSTACGCWIYCGCYADEVNQTARRKPGQDQNWVAPEWGWAWPANRRILYNRASADPDGKPWSERKRYVWWDEGAGEWTGFDVPDFEKTKRPDYQPPEGAVAQHALAGDDPFIMQADGKGWLFVPNGLKDGPLPAHYEPDESPFHNPLYSQQANPARQRYPRPGNEHNDPDLFPYVMTTYRLTEHHTAGGMSRFVDVLSELQPEFFCEVSPELAAERGLEHGGWATVISSRTAIEARVLVTDRIPPLRVQGRVMHQVGLPYHWGQRGLSTGDSANDLFPLTLDPNVHIQEVKAATCDIRPGRRPRGPALPAMVAEYREGRHG